MASPRANIGLRTGLSFDVIDLDNEAAVDALEQARGGREPLQGPVVQTGHGFHWYAKPTGVGNRCGRSSGRRLPGPKWLCTRTALCPSRGSPIPVDQPLARRACARAGLAHSAPCLRTSASTAPNGARGVQGLRTWRATPRASAALPGKGRHPQSPAQYRFVQYGPTSGCRSY